MSPFSLPAALWLTAAFVLAPFVAAIMATLNWSGQKAKLTWSGEHLTWSSLAVGFIAAALLFSPLFGDWFDVWNHLLLLTCGTFTGPLVFASWTKALPFLNRHYSPQVEQAQAGTHAHLRRQDSLPGEVCRGSLTNNVIEYAE
ncbi:TPA: hypothetical protein DEP96_03480 [Candidatus Uhrbacteria bacterium]|nr:hypothetical protein [Candidatus Uhrbacteria bacterium]